MGSGIGFLVIGPSAAMAGRTTRSAMMPSHIRVRTNASIIDGKIFPGFFEWIPDEVGFLRFCLVHTRRPLTADDHGPRTVTGRLIPSAWQEIHGHSRIGGARHRCARRASVRWGLRPSQCGPRQSCHSARRRHYFRSVLPRSFALLIEPLKPHAQPETTPNAYALPRLQG